MNIVSLHVWYWPARGLGLAGEQVHSVVCEAGGTARLLSDEGKLAAQTGHTAAFSRLWKQTHIRAVQVLNSGVQRAEMKLELF